MQKILLSLLLLSSTILAEVSNVEISRDYIEKSEIKIIDIRTESEWEKMGVIKGAYLITFFPEDAEYNPKFFLKELNKVIEKDEQFAIISNSASRIKLVSNFLGKKNKYNVVNLIGGMKKLIKEGYEVETYDPNKKREIENKKQVEQKEIVKKEIVEKEMVEKEEVKVVEKEKTTEPKDSNITK